MVGGDAGGAWFQEVPMARSTDDALVLPAAGALTLQGRQVIIHTAGGVCATRSELMESEAFRWGVEGYLRALVAQDAPLLATLPTRDPEVWTRLLVRLAELPLEDVALEIPEAVDLLLPGARKALLAFVEGLYDHWRTHDRFMVLQSAPGAGGMDRRPYRSFTTTLEALAHLVRGTYRDICEHITGDHPRIYRQVPAGCHVGLIAVPKATPLPTGLREAWSDVPFIRQMWIDPPMILDPPSNTRGGAFASVDRDPLAGFQPDPAEWLCYPAQVGSLVVFAWFHASVMGLGCALANLFELATDAQIAQGPDAVLAFGVTPAHLAPFGERPTVFHEDPDTGFLTGAIPSGDAYSYFGYLKKMALTLHNVAMLRRGRLPFHGALVRVGLSGGRDRRVLVIGDTATGKSETIEAFRALGGSRVRELRVVADDMGSLTLGPDGRLLGSGTETGAFVRLDDLHRGYAFGQIDRAIFMSPSKVNARVVLPVTTLDEVLAAHPVDYLLYANNYESVDETHPVLERFADAATALEVFRAGCAMAKGTTAETGLSRSYFANPFGAPERREAHEVLAEKCFHAAVASGTVVGQIRTRLALPGWETQGPAAVAEALLALMDA